MRVKIFLLKRDSTALHFIFVSSALRRRVQTLPALRNSCIPEGPQVEYVHIQGSPVEFQTPNTQEPDRPQRDPPTAFVVAQQCSSATFASLRFHSRQKKLGDFLKKSLILFFIFFKSVSLKFRNLKLCKSGRPCSSIRTFRRKHLSSVS